MSATEKYLSVSEVAALLNKSPRVVRYMARNGVLPAKKHGRQWLIFADSLPLTTEQRAALGKTAERIVAAAEAAVEPAVKAASGTSGKQRFSVLKLRVYQLASAIYHQTAAACGDHAPAAKHMHACVHAIARGCHSYYKQPRMEHYNAARDAAVSAMVELRLTDKENAIADRIEQELMGPLAGIIRTSEKQNRRSRFQQHG